LAQRCQGYTRQTNILCWDGFSIFGRNNFYTTSSPEWSLGSYELVLLTAEAMEIVENSAKSSLTGALKVSFDNSLSHITRKKKQALLSCSFASSQRYRRRANARSPWIKFVQI